MALRRRKKSFLLALYSKGMKAWERNPDFPLKHGMFQLQGNALEFQLNRKLTGWHTNLKLFQFHKTMSILSEKPRLLFLKKFFFYRHSCIILWKKKLKKWRFYFALYFFFPKSQKESNNRNGKGLPKMKFLSSNLSTKCLHFFQVSCITEGKKWLWTDVVFRILS